MSGVDDAVFLSQWPYETDYNDHFETPKEAYDDVFPLLKQYACEKRANKQKDLTKEEFAAESLKEMRLYDPYYCEGSLVEMLESMGFGKVVNRKRDFYADVENGHVPKHDVLITNPPYSGDHKVWLLDILYDRIMSTTKTQPFLLLLPSWTAGKKYWRDFLLKLSGEETHESPNEIEKDVGVYYIVPAEPYQFRHPEGAGQDESPFHGIWFCYGLPDAEKKLLKAQQKAGRNGRIVRTLKELEEADLVRSPEKQTLQRRANPVQRERTEVALKARDAKKEHIQSIFGKSKKYEKRKRESEATVDQSQLVDAKVQKVDAAKICRHFQTQGCTRGASCRFVHVASE